MRAAALALALALALPAAGEEDWAVYEAGALVSSRSLCAPEAKAIEAVRRMAAAEAKVKVYESAPPPSGAPWWVVPLVAVVAAGVGFGVARAAK